MKTYTKEEIASVINSMRMQNIPLYNHGADMLVQLLDENIRMRQLIPLAVDQAVMEEMPHDVADALTVRQRIVVRVAALHGDPEAITALRGRTP